MTALRRLLALLVLAALALFPTGCIISSSSGVCVNSLDQYGNMIKICDVTAEMSFSTCKVCTTLTSDFAGCTPAWNTGCTAAPDGGMVAKLCDFPLSASVPLCYWYDDPVLFELPSTWLPNGGTWHSEVSADSGTFIFTNAASLLTPAGGGPIVTDPGNTAWILWMDHAPPDGKGRVTGIFQSPAADTGCVKGMEVTLEQAYGSPLAIYPTTGQTFDFTQMPAPGPNAICVGPNTTVPDRKKSWGQLKVLYR